MTLRNRKREGDSASAPQRKRRPPLSVTVHVHPMDQQQARRLSTAVDALLAELVRQEMGRAREL